MAKFKLKRLGQAGLSTPQGLGKLALSMTAGALVGGYGRISYAGTCRLTTTPGTYLCSGAADPTIDVTQNIIGPARDIIIESAPDFGLDTTRSGGAGLQIETYYNTSATDITVQVANIRATDDALSVEAPSDADYPRSTVKIDTSGGEILSQTGTGIRSEAGIGDITITTADVEGRVGIAAGEPATNYYGGYTYDASNISINSTAGEVTGTNGAGIDSRGGNIDITTAGVTGLTDGITAISNTIYDEINIDTTGGTVTGLTGNGILAANERYGYGGPSGSYIDITTANVVGGDVGIGAYVGVYSSADIDTTAGSLTATNGVGISVLGGGNSINVTTADVEGQTEGVYSFDFGIGRQKIDTTAGTVTGNTGSGMAITSLYGDFEVSTGDVVGGTDGVVINSATRSFRPSSLDTSSGSVVGQDGSGIVIGSRDGGLINMTVADVTGSHTGITLTGGPDNDEIEVVIDVRGHVSGGTGIASDAIDGAIEITSTGMIEGTAGTALDLGDSADQVTILDEFSEASDAAQTGLIGASFFGGGDDVLSFVSGDGSLMYQGRFDGLFDGGAGIDTVNFSVGVEDLTRQAGSGTAIDLFFFSDTQGSATLSFVDFEAFTFADDPDLVYSLDELRDLVVPAPIPLPAGLVLMATALGGLGLVQTRRNRSSKLGRLSDATRKAT